MLYTEPSPGWMQKVRYKIRTNKLKLDKSKILNFVGINFQHHMFTTGIVIKHIFFQLPE